MKKWFKRLNNEKGMTLVELLAVVVILGIVAAIAVPSIGKIIDNSKKDAHKANALMIINAAKLAVASSEIDINPTGITSIPVKTNTDGDDLIDKGFLNAMPKDPDSKTAVYTAASVSYNAASKEYSITLTGSKRSLIDISESNLNTDNYVLAPSSTGNNGNTENIEDTED